MWESFFKEMEKNAIAGLLGNAAIGGLTAMEIADQTKLNKQNNIIQPLRGQSSQFKLQSPNAYQFGGSKRMDSQEKASPHSSLY